MMRRTLRSCLQAAAIFAVLLAVLPVAPRAWAVEPDEMLTDPALEARARALSEGLRCMVCQNESIDDSNAPLAHDIRVLVRERIKAGDSDAQVINFLVARYGEFILLKPRLSWHTAALWALPPALVLFGIVILVVAAKRRPYAPESAASGALTAAEQARVAELLRDDEAA